MKVEIIWSQGTKKLMEGRGAEKARLNLKVIKIMA